MSRSRFTPPAPLANMRAPLPDGVRHETLDLFETWCLHPTHLSYEEWLVARTMPPPRPICPPNRMVRA
jgi:hypothetical protein